MTQSFRDLQVWRKSIQLSISVYRLTRESPREELYSLTSQLRRAAASTPSNIAEGQGRLGSAEIRHFLTIARGSNFELQTQSEIARALQFGHPQVLDEAEAMSHEVGKMIHGLLESMKSHAAVAETDDRRKLTTDH